MANRKISDLTALTTPATGDLLAIVDISEAAAADKNKKITFGVLRASALSSVPAGTAAAPSVAFEGYPGTGVYSSGANQLAISTNGTSRIVVDASGRLLVGTSSVTGVQHSAASGTFDVDPQSQINTLSNPCALLLRTDFPGNESGSLLALAKSRGSSVNSNTIVANGDTLGEIGFFGADGTDIRSGAASIQCRVDGTPGANDMPGRLVFSTTADGAASPTERMRINNAGELLVGYTTDNGAYKLQVNSQIFATSATVATSDGRYKENVASLGGCLDLVKALRPVSFTWKPQQDITRIDDEGNELMVREGHNFPEGTQVGFIAQEVQEALSGKPWLSSVIKENIRPSVKNNEGNELAPEERFFGIAEGNLIAVLTNALQESIAKIEALETRLSALEAG